MYGKMGDPVDRRRNNKVAPSSSHRIEEGHHHLDETMEGSALNQFERSRVDNLRKSKSSSGGGLE